MDIIWTEFNGGYDMDHIIWSKCFLYLYLNSGLSMQDDELYNQ